MASTVKTQVSPSSAGGASHRAWERAIHAVTEQHESMLTAAPLYGVQHMALYHHVRAYEQQQQQFQQTSPCLPPQESAMALTDLFRPPAQLLEPMQLTPKQNDQVISLLYDEYRSSQCYNPGRIIADNRSVLMEDYWFQDEDIREAVRFVVSRDVRRDLPELFPSTRWLNAFKRANGLMDAPTVRQEDQFCYRVQCATELVNEGCESEPARVYYEPSLIGDYDEGDQFCSMSESESNEACSSRVESQRPDQQLNSTIAPDGNDRKLYRQSNTVPPEVWERAIEDVVTHSKSLRGSARAHGVHFAALHRRIKKRSQQKEALPHDPHYIPLENEAYLVRVIQARADLGVLMSYTEVEDLLKRSMLNHRSELSTHDTAELARKFRSRVESSVRHLVEDWPLPVVDALYSHLEPAAPTPVATTIPAETGDIVSITSPPTSFVSPRPILPPVSVLHRISSSSGSRPAIPALVFPRGERSGSMVAIATTSTTAELTLTCAALSGVAVASNRCDHAAPSNVRPTTG